MKAHRREREATSKPLSIVDTFRVRVADCAAVRQKPSPIGTSREKCTQHQCLPAQLGSSNRLMSASRQVAPSSSDTSHRMTFVPPVSHIDSVRACCRRINRRASCIARRATCLQVPQHVRRDAA